MKLYNLPQSFTKLFLIQTAKALVLQRTSNTLVMQVSKQFRNFYPKYFNPFKWKLNPSYGTFTALKRFSSLWGRVHPQYITWNRVTWKPRLTPKFKLIPWFLMSLIVLSVNLSFFYIGFREILAHTKDPEMTAINVLILAIYTGASCIASVAILTYPLVDGLCFALGNLQTIKPDFYGMPYGNSGLFNFTQTFCIAEHPTDLISLFLHMVLIFPLQIPLTVCVIPLLRGDIDPSYFWVRDYSIGSSTKIFLRIVLILIASFHGSVVMTDLVISTVNMTQAVLSNLL